MENIYINGNFYNKLTGVQRYAREITRELDKIKRKDFDIFVVVPDKNIVDIEFNNLTIIEKRSFIKGVMWDYLVFSAFVRRKKGIAINFLNRPSIGCRHIVCLHDISCKVRPELHRGTKERIRGLWNTVNYYLITLFSNKIVTVSDFSKNEIIKNFKCLRNSNISVVYPSWQHMQRVCAFEGHIPEPLEEGAFYYSIGTLGENKNMPWIFEVARRHPEEIFAIAGNGNLEKYKRYLETTNTTNVVFLGRVSDELNKKLMETCKAFLLPSLYEGFGLTPLEAIACGAKEIVVSDIPALREAYGNCAVYINPQDAHSFDTKICAVSNVKDVLNKYSWEQSAKLWIEIIEEFGQGLYEAINN